MIPLEQLRACFEGYVPSQVATCDSDGTPNVSYVSQVHYVDPQHVALTFQFFNKTRRNILKNPQATLLVVDPFTGKKYRLALLYRRTEESGALFESMKARLAGLASESGMQDVFVLKGADIYQVLSIDFIGEQQNEVAVADIRLMQLKNWASDLAVVNDLTALFQQLMSGARKYLQAKFAMLLIADHCAQKLYTVETMGYADSGIGSEIAFGCGVIGTAALYKTPIRIGHATIDYNYLQLLNRCPERLKSSIETRISYPGLREPQSQFAMPILLGSQLLGVFYLESEQARAFGYQDEDMLETLLIQCALQIQRLQPAEPESEPAVDESAATTVPDGQLLGVRYFSRDSSVFLDDDYLIKGVAGAILWRLLNLYQSQQRVQFSNKELRLDKALNLPELGDNLETRLLLLQRRLSERCQSIRLEKTGRGSFHLQVNRGLYLSCEA